MTAWLERDTFTAQFAAADSNIGLNTKAPCPSDYGQGQSYWIEEYPIDFEEGCRQAAVPEDADVVIIGTGITGGAAAYQLARQAPGLRVAMFDARGICSGATGRNGGHIARAEAVDFRKMVEKFGTEDSVRLRELITKNRDMLLEAIDEIGGADAVDLKLTGSFAAFGSQKERDEYVADEEACVKAGMKYEGRVIDADELVQVRCPHHSDVPWENRPVLTDSLPRDFAYPPKRLNMALHTSKRPEQFIPESSSSASSGMPAATWRASVYIRSHR